MISRDVGQRPLARSSERLPLSGAREARVNEGEATMRKGHCSVAMLLGTIALTACGGAELSVSRLSDARGAVRAAEEVGANDQPQASLHLQLARDELARAEALAKDRDGERANLYLNRAQADAELALQLTRTEQEQQKARQAWQRVRELESPSVAPNPYPSAAPNPNPSAAPNPNPNQAQ